MGPHGIGSATKPAAIIGQTDYGERFRDYFLFIVCLDGFYTEGSRGILLFCLGIQLLSRDIGYADIGLLYFYICLLSYIKVWGYDRISTVTMAAVGVYDARAFKQYISGYLLYN
ncbi:hypothetical protein ASPWEDRAFT_376508 [Aspergillus wentii DTO 134E9]|uniref:Uncharacterized protein n=1 Tax=Aspergillus wentii DTO 134E9 TaxID=1073089 RepID=A0A1L9RX35_ASPWE|nr:uncharacterized protein ASPWEDRAFT_376508 [Aspergillus wentii DTO 134E9]OJJ39489.1 hypothetical protein ASPWEDRAFT_376508 [Aspergillus wentii DTO 134E9]